MPKTSARQARINSLTEQYEETLSSIYRSKRLVFKLMAMYLALEDNWDEMLDVFGILAGFPTTISGNPLSDEMKLLLSYYKGHNPLRLLLPESGLSEEEQAFLVFRNHWNDSSVKRELERQLQNTLSQRYLTPRIRKHDRPRGRLEDILSDTKYTDDQFRHEVRMSKSNFYSLVDEIRNHPVFSNNSFVNQTPVACQLLVTLRRLGSFGTSAAVGAVARHFGISCGSVCKFTDRCISAIVSFSPKYLYWPKSGERARISARIFSETGLSDCVGFADGILIDFEKRPLIDGGSWYSRKEKYSMNVLVVVDDKKRIRITTVGYPRLFSRYNSLEEYSTPQPSEPFLHW